MKKKIKVFQVLIENELTKKIFQTFQIDLKKININFQISNELIQNKSLDIKSF